METLKRAQNELWEAESAYNASEEKDGNSFYRGLSEMHYRQAAIYAAVAQAEQLKRIADALEGLTPPATAAEREDYGEELRAERKQAQEFLAGTRRGLGLE